MSSPWAKISQPEQVNLSDIMSEEVAKDLQSKEDAKYLEMVTPKETGNSIFENAEIPPELLVDGDLESDAEIARMLQQQFDKEYDEMLKRTEDKFNGASKVSISFSNYRRVPASFDFESDSEEEELEDLRDRKDWDRFDQVQRDFDAIPPCGYAMKNGNMITKHDIEITSRRNVCKMMSFPLELETGDGAGFDMKLPNNVYNSLRVHSKNDQARRHRIHDKKEDRATAEFGMDEYTRILLYKMINSELLENVNGVISIGKEAVVLHADSNPSYTEQVLPKECVIKVFKTTLSEFKQRDKYIKDDYRFKDRIGKQSARKAVRLWAEKEMHNLYRVQKAGIPCPEVVLLKQHVLVMSFIGENHEPAPKLKDAIMSEADYIMAYDQVVEDMKSLYTKANLIHADLSEYNILWYKDRCHLIDVSQSVEPDLENSFYFLMRDCNNITNFFSKKHVPGVISAEELFKDIVGVDFSDKVALLEISDTFKMKPHLVDKPGVVSNYNFDNAWEQSKKKSIVAGMENVNLVDPPLA